VQQFYHGKPARGLSEALEADKRDDACVAENFYLVTAKESVNQNLPRVLPKRIASLVPKMKASDFDYIIFDMPPVMQTSITPRLSTFMDMVLMVVESEKTGREVVQRAQNLLRESRANCGTVLNKHRAYVPKTAQPGSLSRAGCGGEFEMRVCGSVAVVGKPAEDPGKPTGYRPEKVNGCRPCRRRERVMPLLIGNSRLSRALRCAAASCARAGARLGISRIDGSIERCFGP
jgi:hypothetical protein